MFDPVVSRRLRLLVQRYEDVRVSLENAFGKEHGFAFRHDPFDVSDFSAAKLQRFHKEFVTENEHELRVELRGRTKIGSGSPSTSTSRVATSSGTWSPTVVKRAASGSRSPSASRSPRPAAELIRRPKAAVLSSNIKSTSSPTRSKIKAAGSSSPKNSTSDQHRPLPTLADVTTALEDHFRGMGGNSSRNKVGSEQKLAEEVCASEQQIGSSEAAVKLRLATGKKTDHWRRLSAASRAGGLGVMGQLREEKSQEVFVDHEDNEKNHSNEVSFFEKPHHRRKRSLGSEPRSPGDELLGSRLNRLAEEAPHPPQGRPGARAQPGSQQARSQSQSRNEPSAKESANYQRRAREALVSARQGRAAAAVRATTNKNIRAESRLHKPIATKADQTTSKRAEAEAAAARSFNKPVRTLSPEDKRFWRRLGLQLQKATKASENAAAVQHVASELEFRFTLFDPESHPTPDQDVDPENHSMRDLHRGRCAFAPRQEGPFLYLFDEEIAPSGSSSSSLINHSDGDGVVLEGRGHPESLGRVLSGGGDGSVDQQMLGEDLSAIRRHMRNYLTEIDVVQAGSGDAKNSAFRIFRPHGSHLKAPSLTVTTPGKGFYLSQSCWIRAGSSSEEDMIAGLRIYFDIVVQASRGAEEKDRISIRVARLSLKVWRPDQEACTTPELLAFILGNMNSSISMSKSNAGETK
eukprot:CAMPEP_0179004408 /NCGR_PEP_ID=MMETSP0795-20121207/13285_1 /TAXON_ID=88552 /ORGANISM="Amoebophrya sp., Strain Ameob2" /LENGTH=690 /DNA_ID=CAMNT_0020698661 /DNA_START=484 /DNA_END=2556 /DNA_ORIENTATION=+